MVGAGGAAAIGPIVLGADGSAGRAIIATSEDALIRMNGHETFQIAVAKLARSHGRRVARAGLALDDVDLFVYHQANGRILRAVGERLELEPAMVGDDIAEIGKRRPLRSRSRCRCCARHAPAPGQRPARRNRRRLHLGRGVHEWGIT